MFSWHLERLIPCGNFLWSVGKWSTKKLMSTISRSPVISRKKSGMASRLSSSRTKHRSNSHPPNEPVSKPNSSVNNTNSNGQTVKGNSRVSVLPNRPDMIQKKSETAYSSTFTTSRVLGSSARGSVTDLLGQTQYYQPHQPHSLSPARQDRQRQKAAKDSQDVAKNLEQPKLSPSLTLPPIPKSAQRLRTSSVNSLPTEVCAGSRHSPSQSKTSSPSLHQRSRSMTFSQASSQQEKPFASKKSQSMDFASKNETSSLQPQTFSTDLSKYSKQKIHADKQSQFYSSKSGSTITKSQSHPMKISTTSHGIWDIQPEMLVDVPPYCGSSYPLATSRHKSHSESTLQTSSGSHAGYEHQRLSWSSGYKSNSPSPSPSPSRSPSPSSIMKLESKGSASSFKSFSSTFSTVSAVTKSTVSPLMTQSLSSRFDKNDIPVVKVGISYTMDSVRNGLVGLRNIGNTVSLLSVQ